SSWTGDLSQGSGHEVELALSPDHLEGWHQARAQRSFLLRPREDGARRWPAARITQGGVADLGVARFRAGADEVSPDHTAGADEQDGDRPHPRGALAHGADV